MKLLIILGPHAVGKMAVGMKITEKTGMRLFHNHMTIEFAKEIYGEMTPSAWKLVSKIRADVFDSVLHSDLYGFIFTYVWAFNMKEDGNYIYDLIDRFSNKGIESYIVELEAELSVRLERNKTPLRLENKVSKRDLDWSEGELLESLKKYRLNSEENEVKHDHYLRLDNTYMTEEEAADIIIKHFNL